MSTLRTKKVIITLLIMLLLSVAVKGHTENEEGFFAMHGFYKGIGSYMDFPFEDSYTDFFNRLRLHLDLNMGEYLKGVIEYDVEAHIGNFAGSDIFSLSDRIIYEQYVDLDSVLIEEDDFYLRHALYRAYISVRLPGADIKVGRYAIDWGTGRAFNPTDPFYPINPLLLERDEHTGADAVGVDFMLSDVSTLSAVVAGKGKRGEDVQAARFKTNAGGMDLALTGFFDSEFSGGLDVSRTLWNTEFHTALRYGEDGDTEWIAGLDRAFANTLKIGFEYYHTSEGDDDKGDYEWLEWLNGERQFLASDYLFGWIDFEITPLVRLQTYSVANLNDGGIYVNPLVKYSMTTNTELELGCVNFSTDTGDEFSFYPEVYYLQFRCFF